jgi:hypothetical protein
LKFRPFEKARKYARSLGVKNRNQWFNLARNEKVPADIPSNPQYHYKELWKGWGDWLGIGRIPNQERT